MSSARVEGEIHHTSLAIETGAEFVGRCNLTPHETGGRRDRGCHCRSVAPRSCQACAMAHSKINLDGQGEGARVAPRSHGSNLVPLLYPRPANRTRRRDAA